MEDESICLGCGNPIRIENTICPRCGSSIICPGCSTPVQMRGRVTRCFSCGLSFRKAPPAKVRVKGQSHSEEWHKKRKEKIYKELEEEIKKKRECPHKKLLDWALEYPEECDGIFICPECCENLTRNKKGVFVPYPYGCVPPRNPICWYWRWSDEKKTFTGYHPSHTLDWEILGEDGLKALEEVEFERWKKQKNCGHKKVGDWAQVVLGKLFRINPAARYSYYRKCPDCNYRVEIVMRGNRLLRVRHTNDFPKKFKSSYEEDEVNYWIKYFEEVRGIAQQG